jgi:hypothetical protein
MVSTVKRIDLYSYICKNNNIMNVVEEYDWKTALRKKAQQSASDYQVEQVFFDQAGTFIRRSAEPLMVPEHQVGFEIVYRNDDGTRLVGVFIFRIGNTLLYAPVFYLNGTIKNPELLYKTDTKSFVMLDPDWCIYLKAHYMPPMGSGVERNGPHHRNNGELHLDKLMSPGGKFKGAANEVFVEMVESLLELDEPTKEASGSRLKAVLQDLGPDGFQLLKAACENNYSMDNAMYQNFDWEALVPTEEETKEASTEKRPLMVLHPDPALAGRSKEAAIRGFDVEDNRSDVEKQAEILLDSSQAYHQLGVGEGGKLLLSDGSEIEGCLLGYGSNTRTFFDNLSRSNYLDGPISGYNDSCKAKVLLSVEGFNGFFLTAPGTGNAFSSEAPNTSIDYSKYTREPTVGTETAWCLVDTVGNKIISDPFFITEKKGNNVTVHASQWTRKEGQANETSYTLFLNKNARDVNVYAGIINDRYKFIPLAVEEHGDEVEVKSLPVNLVSESTDIPKLLLSEGFIGGTVQQKSASEYTLHLSDHKGRTFMSKEGCAICAAAAFGCDYDTAEALVESANTGKPVDFFVKPASSLYWDDVPDFTESYDPTFGVATQSPEEQVILASGPEEERRGPRVGDITKLESGMDIDSLGGPTQVDNFAKNVGMRQIFEHGVIGSLLKEFDAQAVVERYLPDLEQGLDRTGRLLFLANWSSADFGRLFGTDDVTAVEQSLASSFKTQGRLLLDLLQRNREAKTSTTDAG